ncbi:hypothetical protein GPB2148_1322 [marine gamma proteobacterium HTCC2148]|nr:hypothetical protein GPB2148_1322 [marine gamma proteobacterium HTCC2148]
MNKISGGGFVAGLIVWLVIVGYFSTQMACLRADSCGAGDMMLAAICAVGFLVPAWLIAIIVSGKTD